MHGFFKNGGVAIAAVAALWMASPGESQPPAKVPSSEQEMIVNLQLQVRDLRQALTQLQQQVATLKKGVVRAPFEVTDAAGNALLSVDEGPDGGLIGLYDEDGVRTVQIDSSSMYISRAKDAVSVNFGVGAGHAYVSATQANQRAVMGYDAATGAMGVRLLKGSETNVSMDLENGVGNFQVFQGASRVGFLGANTGRNGARLQLSQPSGGALFSAGVSEGKGEGFAKVVSKGGAAINLGANDNGIVAVRVASQDGGPASAGLSVQPDNNGVVYAGKPGKDLTLMRVYEGHGYIAVLDDSGKSLVEATNTASGGSVRVANTSGAIVANLEVNPKTNGGHGEYTDSSGTPLLKLGATGLFGDICITIHGGGRCLGELLPGLH